MHPKIINQMTSVKGTGLYKYIANKNKISYMVICMWQKLLIYFMGDFICNTLDFNYAVPNQRMLGTVLFYLF
jgi:hypothetical protein